VSLKSKKMKKSNQKKIIAGFAASLAILAVLLGVAGKNLLLGHHRQPEKNLSEIAAEKDFSKPGTLRPEQKKEEIPQRNKTNTREDSWNTEDVREDMQDTEEGSQEEEQGKDEMTEQEEPAQKSREEILQEKIQDKLAEMSLEEKAAQLFFVTPEALTGFSSVTEAGEAVQAAMDQYPVGGLALFKENISSEAQVLQMLRNQQSFSQERIGLPLFTGVDEEGGQVTRIASCAGMNVPSFSDISQIGASKDPGAAYTLGDTIGEYLSRMGFNLDFAPVADVLTNPENTVVKRRSYGSSPQLVSQMVLENLKGLQQHQVYGCVKHFPGHGATIGDTHQGYAYTDKTWEELRNSEIIPFKDSIDWGVDFVMVGHISLPNVTGDDVPASLSSHIITELLRGELGYDGIVLTDALNMGAVTQQYTSAQAAVNAILAGTDMILMPQDFKSAYEGIWNALQDGTITEERLNESLTRILRVKLQMG